MRKSVESIRPKFIFFSFIGSEVPVLQRARVSVQRPDVEKMFNGYSVRMDISGAVRPSPTNATTTGTSGRVERACLGCAPVSSVLVLISLFVSPPQNLETFTKAEIAKESDTHHSRTTTQKR